MSGKFRKTSAKMGVTETLRFRARHLPKRWSFPERYLDLSLQLHFRRFKRMRKLFILALAVVLGLAAKQVYAQGNATLTGTVTDPNGAVVAGATVKATNTGTNISYDTQTTDSGLYRFPTLPVGIYKLSVEATGFKGSQVENVTLTVGQTTTQDIKLEVGAPTETVTVQSGGEQLAQPNESSVSTLLNRNVWENFPLENRDTNEFINFLPGS